MKCYKCGSDNLNDANFCKECGLKFTPPSYTTSGNKVAYLLMAIIGFDFIIELLFSPIFALNNYYINIARVVLLLVVLILVKVKKIKIFLIIMFAIRLLNLIGIYWNYIEDIYCSLFC